MELLAAAAAVFAAATTAGSVQDVTRKTSVAVNTFKF